MDLDTLIAAVDQDRFLAACAWARETAPGCGTNPKPLAGQESHARHGEIIHELASTIGWADDVDPGERLEALLALYEQMPGYAVLMYLDFEHLAPADRQRLWARFRAFMSGDDDALADPVAYTLWCDYFERSDRVQEAWSAMLADAPTDRRLERLLARSGPVPYALKAPLYRQLLNRPRWHAWIFRSLLFSRFDVYGSIDRGRAAALLEQLDLPADTPFLELLKSKLV